MPKTDDAKKRMMLIAQYLYKYTDTVTDPCSSNQNHKVTTSDISAMLESEGISAAQGTICNDIKTLVECGFLDIITDGGRNGGYHVCSRLFQLSELQVLIDSVLSSKFLTKKATEQLIDKIEALCSVYEAKTLHKSVDISNTIKASNNNIHIYSNIDIITNAIHNNKSILFQYLTYNEKKVLIPKHNGQTYSVSPYSLIWNDENYYLISYDNDANSPKTFRVDKMINISESSYKRCGQDIMSQSDISNYTKGIFGMYSGEKVKVKMRIDNNLVGATVDVLGKDVDIIPDDENHSIVISDVQISDHFFGWVLGIRGAEILWPEYVVSQMKDALHKQLDKYK